MTANIATRSDLRLVREPLPNSAVSEALAETEAAFSARNPASRALFERAQVPMPGGNTRTALHYAPFPLYLAKSDGAFVTDVDGHRYLDVLGEFTAGLFGHSHPALLAAIAEAAAQGISTGGPGEAEVTLAELVCARFPSLDKVRFCNSGTEANLYALTLARHATGRTRLLGFSGAYHGGVLTFGNGADSPMNVPFDWTLCRYNDSQGACAAIERLGTGLAAVIVEPMMSNGGCIPARADFLRSLREACDATGALLVFDEVVSSRMGAHGLGHRLGIAPDLATFGKYLGGGFSFGAFGGRADLMDHFDPRRPGNLSHAGTFNNNVFTMNVGRVALGDVFTPEVAEALWHAGEALRARLQSLAGIVGGRICFTGVGSCMNVHFVPGPVERPDDLAGEPRELFALFHLDLMEQGVYVARRGQINLSLPMTTNDHDHIVAATEAFLHRRRELIVALC